MLAISLTIWLVTLPLVMARFHVFTPVSVLVNPLVWAPMAVALVSGLRHAALGRLGAAAGRTERRVCNACLWLVETLVGLAQRLPGGHFWVPGPADWWLLGFYGGLAALAAFPRLRPPRRWCLALLALWITVGFAAGSWTAPPTADGSSARFSPWGTAAPRCWNFLPARRCSTTPARWPPRPPPRATIAGFLWSRGITHLDAVVLSHADVDHYNGLPGVLERFSVGAIYVTPQMFEKHNPAVLFLHDAIAAAASPCAKSGPGERFAAGGDCAMEVIHPPRQGVFGGDNANSLVLLVQCRGHRILLTGDLAPPGLDDVMAERRCTATPCWCRITAAARASRPPWPPGARPAGPSSAATGATTCGRSWPRTRPSAAACSIPPTPVQCG